MLFSSSGVQLGTRGDKVALVWPQEPGAWVFHRLGEAPGTVSPVGPRLGVYCAKTVAHLETELRFHSL